MKQTIKYIRRLALFTTVTLLAVSCKGMIEHFDPPACEYTVQLQYHYNQENTSLDNQFARYVKSLEAYIFDENGILYAIESVKADECSGEWVTELTLPPGKYSVIAVGNRSIMSRTHDQGKDVVIGTTKREDMLLTLETRSVNGHDDGSNFLNTGRLYHGYRTFSILPDAPSFVRVDMVHSHLDLRFTIRWKGNAAPNNTGDFYVLLTDVPSQYGLMPEYIYEQPKAACQLHDATSGGHDSYNSTCLEVRHHIVTVQKTENVVSHRNDVYLSDNVISGQALTYRLRNAASDCTATKISLWRENGARSGTPERLMKEIHLNDFLNRSFEDLDLTLKQQYHIVFEIDPATGQVETSFANIADWNEGGGLN